MLPSLSKPTGGKLAAIGAERVTSTQKVLKVSKSFSMTFAFTSSDCQGSKTLDAMENVRTFRMAPADAERRPAASDRIRDIYLFVCLFVIYLFIDLFILYIYIYIILHIC
jgi:hypothetical protein